MADREWRVIPGYNGFYEISFLGEVRSYRNRWGRTKRPKLLTPYKTHRNSKVHGGNAFFVKLTDETGKSKEITVIKIMADVWKGGKPAGMVAYHINGDLGDNRADNIGFITREKLGKLTGSQSKRKTVEKVAESGEVVEIYLSAREAGRKNHMSYQTVLDRCNHKVKNAYALDGHTYRFEER